MATQLIKMIDYLNCIDRLLGLGKTSKGSWKRWVAIFYFHDYHPNFIEILQYGPIETYLREAYDP